MHCAESPLLMVQTEQPCRSLTVSKMPQDLLRNQPGIIVLPARGSDACLCQSLFLAPKEHNKLSLFKSDAFSVCVGVGWQDGVFDDKRNTLVNLWKF